MFPVSVAVASFKVPCIRTAGWLTASHAIQSMKYYLLSVIKKLAKLRHEIYKILYSIHCVKCHFFSLKRYLNEKVWQSFIKLCCLFSRLIVVIIRDCGGRYPNVACDLITSDVNEITETLVTTESLLNSVYTFLESDDDLNPLQASFFSKVMGLVITRRSHTVSVLFSCTLPFSSKKVRRLRR